MQIFTKHTNTMRKCDTFAVNMLQQLKKQKLSAECVDLQFFGLFKILRRLVFLPKCRFVSALNRQSQNDY